MPYTAGNNHRAALANRLDSPELLLAPGIYDGLSALLVEQAGFDCGFVSGAGLSFARFGRPDMGLVSATEVSDAVSAMRERVAMPLIVDMDTGFGNALNVQRTVREFESAGASALQMEDQQSPKRCGHMAGKTVIPAEEMVGKIKAALDARQYDKTLIIARTDALGVNGFEDALDRAEQYLEAGADALFIEAPSVLDQVEQIGRRFGQRTPLVYNLVEGNNGPLQNAAELQALHFRIALFPVALLHRTVPVMQGLLQTLRDEGSTASLQAEMLDLPGINDVLGAPELLATGKRYSPDG